MLGTFCTRILEFQFSNFLLVILVRDETFAWFLVYLVGSNFYLLEPSVVTKARCGGGWEVRSMHRRLDLHLFFIYFFYFLFLFRGVVILFFSIIYGFFILLFVKGFYIFMHGFGIQILFYSLNENIFYLKKLKEWDLEIWIDKLRGFIS